MDPLISVGRVPNPENLNLEPILVEIVGYKHDQHTGVNEEVAATFPCKPIMPAGAVAAFVRNAGPNGELPFPTLLACLKRCLDPDAVDRFDEFIDSDEHSIEQQTLADVFNALVEHYTARPTTRPSTSSSGGPATKQMSRAAARSAASRSKTSRPS